MRIKDAHNIRRQDGGAWNANGVFREAMRLWERWVSTCATALPRVSPLLLTPIIDNPVNDWSFPCKVSRTQSQMWGDTCLGYLLQLTCETCGRSCVRVSYPRHRRQTQYRHTCARRKGKYDSAYPSICADSSQSNHLHTQLFCFIFVRNSAIVTYQHGEILSK